MGRAHRLAGVALLLMTSLLAGAPSTPSTPSIYVSPGDIDYVTLLGEPPANDSPEYRADMAEVVHEQNRRTSEQVARCRSEMGLNVTLFADVLGDDFDANHLPLTIALLRQARGDTDKIDSSAKKHWKRPRPYLANAEVQPCVALEKSTAYPSGHASCGRVYGRILSELFPEKRQALMARADLVGTDRVIGGVHYPSDVAAGQKLGDAIADKLLANGDFRAALDHARDECAASTVGR